MAAHWQETYFGLRTFPPGIDDFELTTFFSFSADERECILSRRHHLYRMAVAIHIGFIRMTGRTLDAFEHVPRKVLTHLGEQLEIEVPDVASLRSLYEMRPRSLAEHQRFAYEALGFQQMTEHQRRYVVRWLRETLRGRTIGGSILPELKRWFYKHRILLIQDRELRRLVVQAQTAHEEQLFRALVDTYGYQKLFNWDKALSMSHGDSATTVQTWLDSAPRKHSTVQIRVLFEKIDFLYGLGVQDLWPECLNVATIREYGHRCANRPPSVSKRIAPVRRAIETACFLRYALCAATDQMLAMLRRWIQAMATKAMNTTAPDFKNAHGQLRDFAKEVRALAIDATLTHEELSAKLIELADHALQQAKVSRAALARAYLIEHPRQARAILARLVLLPFGSTDGHPVAQALDVLRRLYGEKTNRLPREQRIDFGRAWREMIDSDDRVKAMAAFEWATLSKLRLSLRNKSVYLGHSFSFLSQASLLISEEVWKAERNMHYGHLGLPQSAPEFLRPITEQLSQRLQQLARAVETGEVRIDSDGIHIERMQANKEELRVAELRRALYAQRPPGQIPEMMLEIDSKTRFSWLLLGREPRSGAELLLTYAGIFALSTSMTAAEVSRMIPGASAEAIRQMMKRLADERRLRMASDEVAKHFYGFEVTQHFGRADLASSDMMTLRASRENWQSYPDPRTRTQSVGLYSHKSDRWGVLYNDPIVPSRRRQAGFAIEGVLRQTVIDEITHLAVDTHGWTYFASFFSRLQGFDLCPALADLKSRRLHVPTGFEVPEVLRSVVDCDVDEDLIAAGYDGAVRLAASVRSGLCSAVQALDWYGADARGQLIYDAGVQAGMLTTAVFLADYFVIPAFRGELRHVLNRGEATHTLYRAVHTGQIPTEIGKRDEMLHAISSALTLVVNVIMAWNASHMQTALERMLAEGSEPKSEDLRRVAPTNIEGINLRGVFDFPIEKYARWILPSTAPANAAFRAKSGSV